jgi:hypothetical protein
VIQQARERRKAEEAQAEAAKLAIDVEKGEAVIADLSIKQEKSQTQIVDLERQKTEAHA